MRQRILISLLLLLTLSFPFTSIVSAQEASKRLEDIQKEELELQDKINRAQKNIKSFSDQIAYMDNQIKLTTLKIQDTQKKITVLENDIGVLSQKITRVEDSLSLLQQTLLERIQASYALGRPSKFELYLKSDGFDDTLTSYHYLEILQKNDLKLLTQMQSTKQNYGDQKTSLQERQDQLKVAKADLDQQSSLLAQQKADKEKLLTATKSDEKRYQQILAQLRAEASAIENAIANSGNLSNGTPVKKGDVIALMGNSGAPSCSTGAHLHFEVRVNGVLHNPSEFLKPIDLSYDDEHVGRINAQGSWDWPMGNPTITQEYGMSYWARLGFYGGGPHTGIDMVNRASSAIHAVADGTIYKASTKCGSSILKYAMLDHGNGIKTYYLHIQ